MAAATINREASALLANPKITTRLAQLRAEAAKEAALSRAWVLSRLMKNAEVALGERTIKLRVQRKDKESGKVDVGEIEITDRDAQAANRALELLGKTDECRLFIDRLEATGKDGAPLLEQPPTRDVARAVLAILRDAQVADAPEQPSSANEVDEPDEDTEGDEPETDDTELEHSSNGGLALRGPPAAANAAAAAAAAGGRPSPAPPLPEPPAMTKRDDAGAGRVARSSITRRKSPTPMGLRSTKSTMVSVGSTATGGALKRRESARAEPEATVPTGGQPEWPKLGVGNQTGRHHREARKPARVAGQVAEPCDAGGPRS